jgi:YD repeat-containing protein
MGWICKRYPGGVQEAGNNHYFYGEKKMNFRFLYSTIMLLLLASPAFSATITYEYDELDRLHEVTLENGINITYEYDQIGNMISKTPSGNVATITATAMDGGNIYPSGSFVTTFGGNKTYSIVPSPGYVIESVYVDGASQGAINSRTFSNITANHTIIAYFKDDPTTCSYQPVRIARATPVYFTTLQAAYNAATDGDVIQAQTQLLVENLSANRNIAVTIDGGYTCNYGSNPDDTYLLGAVNLSSGTVTMKNYQIMN